MRGAHKYEGGASTRYTYSQSTRYAYSQSRQGGRRRIQSHGRRRIGGRRRIQSHGRRRTLYHAAYCIMPRSEGAGYIQIHCRNGYTLASPASPAKERPKEA